MSAVEKSAALRKLVTGLFQRRRGGFGNVLTWNEGNKFVTILLQFVQILDFADF